MDIKNLDEVKTVTVKGKTYQRWVPGTDPEGKVLVLAIPMSKKTSISAKTQKPFTSYVNIGSMYGGIPVSDNQALKVSLYERNAVNAAPSDFAL